MIWKIPAARYQSWPDFTIELKQDLVLMTGECYHLNGMNGAGKTTLLRKVLIPELQKQPLRQYIMYLEQHVQSQFDALKAHAALQKPSVHIYSRGEMLAYQISIFQQSVRHRPRHLFIIADECEDSDKLSQWLAGLELDSFCLIYTCHGVCAFDCAAENHNIKLSLNETGHSILAVE
jgi:ABC-type multidrug transport system ATPase subunit